MSAVLTGIAIAGAAILASIEPRAKRAWTPRADGFCGVCGGVRSQHHAIDDACVTHSADSLTREQILEWHRTTAASGGAPTALDASPELRAAAAGAGVLWREPTERQQYAARRMIANDLNRRRKEQAIADALDSATVAITGRSAAEVSADLDAEIDAHPEGLGPYHHARDQRDRDP